MAGNDEKIALEVANATRSAQAREDAHFHAFEKDTSLLSKLRDVLAGGAAGMQRTATTIAIISAHGINPYGDREAKIEDAAVGINDAAREAGVKAKGAGISAASHVETHPTSSSHGPANNVSPADRSRL
jgi:hypothetical protein